MARQHQFRGRFYDRSGTASVKRCIAWLLILCALSAWGELPDDARKRLDETIAAARTAFETPSVSVAVTKSGNIVYTRAFGDADTNTRYAIGSISKQFTVAALLLAQEQGKLSLADPVSRYFPEFTRASEITIKQLLSHTSGYEDYAPQDYMIPEWAKATSPEALLEVWAKKPLNFDPGTRWQYSNTNYVLAGKIFEKASEQQLLPYLKQRIFEPLGMTSAGDCTVKTAADATAYTRFALGPARPALREGPGWYFAAGDLCMTASDLARWDAAFIGKRILSAKSYQEFVREVKLKSGAATHYALGLGLGEMAGTPMLSHSGEVSGFLAMNSVFPKKQLGIAVLSNEDNVGLIGTVTRQIASELLEPQSKKTQRNAEVRAILEDLQHGRIDRERFTAHANAYFVSPAIEDYRASLAPLGKLVALTLGSEQSRGGMTHLTYRAHFERNTVALNIYVTPGGKYEQFLVEEVF
jgi:D-alanyl-D-alanine carboxypeptidase